MGVLAFSMRIEQRLPRSPWLVTHGALVQPGYCVVHGGGCCSLAADMTQAIIQYTVQYRTVHSAVQDAAVWLLT